jgi:hypothetical protein
LPVPFFPEKSVGRTPQEDRRQLGEKSSPQGHRILVIREAAADSPGRGSTITVIR